MCEYNAFSAMTLLLGFQGGKNLLEILGGNWTAKISGCVSVCLIYEYNRAHM